MDNLDKLVAGRAARAGTLTVDAPWTILGRGTHRGARRARQRRAAGPRHGRARRDRDSTPFEPGGLPQVRAVLENLVFVAPQRPAAVVRSLQFAVRLLVADTRALRAVPITLQPGNPVDVFGLCAEPSAGADLVLQLDASGDLVVRARVSRLTRVASQTCFDRDGLAMPRPGCATALRERRWVIERAPGSAWGASR